MFDEFADPRPAGVDAPDGVFVLLERATCASLTDVLAAPDAPKVLHMLERDLPTPVAHLHRFCHARLFERAARAPSRTTIRSIALGMLCGETTVGAVGYALMTGRHGDTRVVAIIPDCGDRCLARVAIGEGGEVDPA